MDGKELNRLVLPTSYDISRIQMTATKYDLSPSKNLDSVGPIFIDHFDFFGFKKKYDSNIVFFKDKDFMKAPSVAEKVLRIVTSQKYRVGSMEILHIKKYEEFFLKSINHFIERNEPIKFMLPAFPFKIKNPLKSRRGDADLAEVASFCKLNEINLQIKRVYPAGAEFHIFHDGHLYYRHFLHLREDADRYLRSLRLFVDKLELGEVVKIKDAFEELEKFDDFPRIYEQAREEITNLWSSDKDTNKKIFTIRKSARENINLSDIPEETLLQIQTMNFSDLPNDIQKIKKEIDERADACALEYMIVQHALEKLDFFYRSIPGGIRMTVHPKEGQIGIYLVKRKTFLLPWMGVGILKKNGETSVRYEIEVKDNKDFIPIIIKGEQYPFYYEQK